jgi:hypothetical protein
MSLQSMLNTWLGRTIVGSKKRKPFRKRPLGMEALEQRLVLDVGSSQASHFASGLYYDLLHRQPSHAEVDGWVYLLAHTNLSAAEMAQDFVNSPEYRTNWLENNYQSILGRAGGQIELAGWLVAMQEGMNEQQVLADFLLSPEYLGRVGNTNQGWITGWYQNLLGRAPDAPSLNIWLQDLASGTLSAAAIERAIENSTEAYSLDVQNAYRNILGRDGSAPEVAGWVDAMSQGLTFEGLAVAIASSPEYINQQQGVDLPLLGDHSTFSPDAPIASLASGSLPGEGPATGPAPTSTPVNSPTPLVQTSTWVPAGPAPIKNGQAPGRGLVSGRVTGIAVTGNTLTIATAGGGIWQSTNAGTSWTPKTEDTEQEVLTIGAIAAAGGTSNVFYAGTGEADNSLDSYYGAGILKSTDGGASWGNVGPQTIVGKGVTKIAVDPANANNVLAAVSNATVTKGSLAATAQTGIFKSTDGGTTWVDTTTSTGLTPLLDQYTDVVFDTPSSATTAATVFMAVGAVLFPGTTGVADNGVYKSTDGGSSWVLAGNFPSGSQNGVIRIAVAPSNPSTVYAAITDVATGNLLAIEKSTDTGTTWSKLTVPPSLEYMGGQGEFDSTLVVSPNDPNRVFAGGGIGNDSSGNPVGSRIIATTDGGANWFDVSGIAQNTSGPHAGHHASVFDSAGRLLVGTDGGIWRLDNAGTVSATVPPSWTNLNGNTSTPLESLSITTFNGVAAGPTNANTLYGGSQGNGRDVLASPIAIAGPQAWNLTHLGDGGFIHVDPTTPTTVYGEGPGVSFQFSTDSGTTWHDDFAGIKTDDGHNFYLPFVVDSSNPAAPHRLLIGTDHIYEKANEDTTNPQAWTELGTQGLAGVLKQEGVEAIGVPKGDPNRIYITTFRENAANPIAHFFVTRNHGASWTSSALPDFLPRSLPDIEVDPANEDIVYVVQSAFALKRIFKSTDGGTTWVDFTNTFPQIPINALVIDPTSPASNRTLYAGTDGSTQGAVLVSTDGGLRWSKLGTGIPNVRVTSLQLVPGVALIAGTYGRGAWLFPFANGGGGTPSLSINDVSGNRPAVGTMAPFTFTVSLSAAATQTVTVNFATQDDTAHANVDYVPNSGTLTFAAGVLTQTITVQVIGTSDTTTKDFFVNLSSPTNATVSKGQGKGTIIGQTTGASVLSINNVTGPRPATGMVPFNFTVTLSPASTQAVTVHFATQDNSARAGLDYLAASGTLAFQPNATTQTITIQVIGSTDPNNKVFFVNLSSPTGGATISKGQGVGTILGSQAARLPDQFEPDDSSDQAHNFGALNAGTESFANLSIFNHPNGLPDVDWYRWSVATTGIVSVFVDYRIFDGTDLNLRLFSLDAGGFLHEIGSSRNMNTSRQKVSVAVTAGETILAWVYGFNHSQGTYQLTMTLQ